MLPSRWIAVLLTILLAAALRLHHLGFHSLWYDEAFTAWVAAQTPRDAVWLCLQDVVHPPLYYILMLVWTRFVGNSEFALRALSAGLGLLGVPLLHQLGQRGWNHRVGLAAAVLWACSPFAVWYAQEVRMYALLTVVGMAAILCLARALPQGSQRWLVANAVLNLIGLYTHYFYLFILLSQYLYLGVTLRRHREAFRRWFLLSGTAVVLYLPWLIAILLGNFYRAQIAWIEPLSLRTAWETFWDLTAGKGRPLDALAALSPLVLAGGVVAAGVTRRGKRRSPIPGLVWISLLLPTALVLLISLQQPLLHSRFQQIVLPAFLLLAASGLTGVPRPPWGTLLVALVILAWIPALLGMYQTPARFNRDWRVAMQDLTARAETGDVVAFRGGQGYHPYWYYYQGPTMERISLVPEDGIGVLEAKAAGAQRVWLVVWDPNETCQVPKGFTPGPGDSLTMADTRCFPQALTVLYTREAK